MDKLKENILLVEDEILVAMGTLQRLSREGYNVIFAQSGETAIDIVRAKTQRIDLVLLDLNLNDGMDGVDTAKAILHDCDIPIVFLSAGSEQEIIEKTVEITSYGYVQKQSDYTVLLAYINMVFRLHKANFDPAKYRMFLQSMLEQSYKSENTHDIMPDKYRKLIENDNNLICEIDDQGRYSFVSPSYLTVLGIEPEALIGKPAFDLYHPDDAENAKKKYTSLKNAVSASRDVWRLRHRNGEWKWMECSATVFGKNDGTFSTIVMSIDVSERMTKETALAKIVENNENLIEELLERFKNNLNVVSTFLNFEKGKMFDKNSENALFKARGRIHSISAIYERLNLSKDLATVDLHMYIKDIANTIFETFNIDTERIQLAMMLYEVNLDSKLAVPLGLIVNELITNALKYAHPEDAKGKIRIDLKKADDNVTLCVADDGVGLPDTFDDDSVNSTGFNLIRMLTKLIGGEMKIEADEGTKVFINFKL